VHLLARVRALVRGCARVSGRVGVRVFYESQYLGQTHVMRSHQNWFPMTGSRLAEDDSVRQDVYISVRRASVRKLSFVITTLFTV